MVSIIKKISRVEPKSSGGLLDIGDGRFISPAHPVVEILARGPDPLREVRLRQTMSQSESLESVGIEMLIHGQMGYQNG